MRHATLALMLVVACYDAPSEPPCTVTCNAPGESDGVCPGGAICGGDFLCHPAGADDCARCLRDDFDDGVIDPATWISPFAGGVTEEGGMLQLVPEAYHAVRSTDRWDLSDGALVVEVVESVRTGESAANGLRVTYDAGHSYLIELGGSGLILFQQFADTVLDENSRAVTIDDRIWRIVHDRDVVELATSPDGATWTIGLTAIARFAPTSVEIELYAGGAGGTNVVKYDDLRLTTPACPAAAPF